MFHYWRNVTQPFGLSLVAIVFAAAAGCFSSSVTDGVDVSAAADYADDSTSIPDNLL